MDYFSTRRTIRAYSSRPLSDADLDAMLQAATQAPTTGSMQLYSIIVTRSEQGKAALAPAHFNQPTVQSAQAVVTFCADIRRFERWCAERQATPGFRNFQSFTSALLDATIVAQQFVTIAEMRGLGTCYLGTTTWNAPEIIAALGLPSGVIPVITVTVGYPAEPLPPVQPRLPLGAVVHRERYVDPDIDAAYTALEAEEANRRFVAENGKQTLAQVFTDVRYPQAANEQFSTKFLTLLRTHSLLD